MNPARRCNSAPGRVWGGISKKWDTVDWTKDNETIGREMKVSRDRIRQIRKLIERRKKDLEEIRHTAQLHFKDKGDSLDGYVFVDLSHAREWLQQEWVKPQDYSIGLVDILWHYCTCGDRHRKTVPTSNLMSVEEFLALHAAGE